MNLVHDWKRIVKKAWVMRWIAVAAILSGIEVGLPFLDDRFPRGVFAVLSMLATCGAFVARILAQPKMYEPDSKK